MWTPQGPQTPLKTSTSTTLLPMLDNNEIGEGKDSVIMRKKL